jgi:hypothetical protein
MVDRSTPNHHTRIVIGTAKNPTKGNPEIVIGLVREYEEAE